mgnify:CR=1 FL=1
MGINKQTLKFMLNEHNHKPFEGSFLSLGKQSITIERNELFSILEENNFSTDFEYKPDTESRAGQKFESIDDEHLFKIFKNLVYKSSDHSDYENADLIIDLNKDCPKEYENKFDLIYSGGTLDNIFNPAQGLINIFKMLKPGGRALITEASAYHAGVYCAMSPEWFASFFTVNDCTDVQIHSYCARSSVNQWVFDTDLFKWGPTFTRRKDFDYVESSNSVGGQMYSMIIAEKSEDPQTEVKIPIQGHYIQPENIDWIKLYEKYNSSTRKSPSVKVVNQNVIIPLLTDHFSYVGSEY